MNISFWNLNFKDELFGRNVISKNTEKIYHYAKKNCSKVYRYLEIIEDCLLMILSLPIS